MTDEAAGENIFVDIGMFYHFYRTARWTREGLNSLDRISCRAITAFGLFFLPCGKTVTASHPSAIVLPYEKATQLLHLYHHQ